MALENAAKALAVLEDVKAKTLWSHDVGKIVDELDDSDTDALRSLMAAAPQLVKSPNYITMWRKRGAYGSPTEVMTVQQVASPAFARSTGLIACEVAEYVAEAAHQPAQGRGRRATMGYNATRPPDPPRPSHRRPHRLSEPHRRGAKLQRPPERRGKPPSAGPCDPSGNRPVRDEP